MSKATIKLDGKPIRILLGKDACNIMNEDGINELILQVGVDCFIIYDTLTISEGMDLFTVLSEFNGWDDYMILTEDEYQKIINL
jgi:hypothetical protein